MKNMERSRTPASRPADHAAGHAVFTALSAPLEDEAMDLGRQYTRNKLARNESLSRYPNRPWSPNEPRKKWSLPKKPADGGRPRKQ